MTSTSTNQKTKVLDTTDTNGDYSQFLQDVAATLQDLKDCIHAEWNKTLPGTFENIELMSLGVSLQVSLGTVNMFRGRLMSKSMVTSAIRNATPATKTDSKSSRSKNATENTSKPTGSHSNNSRTGRTRK